MAQVARRWRKGHDPASPEVLALEKRGGHDERVHRGTLKSKKSAEGCGKSKGTNLVAKHGRRRMREAYAYMLKPTLNSSSEVPLLQELD